VVSQPIQIVVDPKKLLGKKFEKAIDEIQDLRIPLQLIKESWHRGNASIFAISGPGKWADLTPKYKAWKRRQIGSEYPILFLSGDLKAALTEPNDSQAVGKFPTKKTLLIGVNPDNKIFNYLNSGTRKMRARPFIILGVEQTAPASLNKRVEIWTKILRDYVLQVSRPLNG
jgi:phage gpG-like protein